MFSVNPSIIEKKIIYKNGEEFELKKYNLQNKLVEHNYWIENRRYFEKYNSAGKLLEKSIDIKSFKTGYLRKDEITRYDDEGNQIYHKKYRKRFFEGDDPDWAKE